MEKLKFKDLAKFEGHSDTHLLSVWLDIGHSGGKTGAADFWCIGHSGGISAARIVVYELPISEFGLEIRTRKSEF